MNKTAMQELIELMKQMPAFQYEPVVHGIYNKATELLDKECQQIIDAGNNVNEYYGAKKFPNGFDIGLDYYQKTYNDVNNI